MFSLILCSYNSNKYSGDILHAMLCLVTLESL